MAGLPRISEPAPAGGWLYLVALGSNAPHHRHGLPAAVLAATVRVLAAETRLVAVAPVIASAPLGPSLRRYANGAVMVRSPDSPPQMLARLKRIEREMGRKAGGRRWGSRVVDCDIVLWEGGRWRSPGLTVPHAEYRRRAFVTGPAAAIAPGWRDPAGGKAGALTLRQLHSRLTRARALPKRKPRHGP